MFGNGVMCVVLSKCISVKDNDEGFAFTQHARASHTLSLAPRKPDSFATPFASGLEGGMGLKQTSQLDVLDQAGLITKFTTTLPPHSVAGAAPGAHGRAIDAARARTVVHQREQKSKWMDN
jgi:hypothetical protein